MQLGRKPMGLLMLGVATVIGATSLQHSERLLPLHKHRQHRNPLGTEHHLLLKSHQDTLGTEHTSTIVTLETE